MLQSCVMEQRQGTDRVRQRKRKRVNSNTDVKAAGPWSLARNRKAPD